MFKSRRKSHRPITLRPQISFRSARDKLLSGDVERQSVQRASESGSVVSPLHEYPRHSISIVQHNSFNSYFRPALIPRRRYPLSPPPLSPRSPHQSPADQPSPSTEQRTLPTRSHSVLVPSPPHRLYRKQVTRPKQPAADGARSPLGSSVVLAMRRRSTVHRRVSSSTGGTLPANLGRRNTVVGGGAAECLPPPIPLSLREIYRLSRRGSLHSRHNSHGRRQSTFSVLRFEKDTAWTSSKASVGVSRCESGRSRRLASVGSGLTGDGDDVAVDVRRRRSYVDSDEWRQHMERGRDQPRQQSLSSHTTHDDAGKTHTFSIILVGLLAFAFIIV